MKNLKNPWKTLNRKEVYQNPWIQVYEDKVIQPDGKQGIYGFVHPRNKSIKVLPYDGKGYIYLVGQIRYIFETYSWEIPAGTTHSNEPVEQAALRELEEETGLVAEKLTKISIFNPSNGISDEEVHLFLAEGLTQKKAHPDATERITVKKILLTEAIAMVERFEIRDIASVVALQYLQLKVLNKKLN